MVRRLGAALVAVALSLGAVAPAATADEATGTARVTLADAPGDPVVGGLVLLPVGSTWETAYRSTHEATHDFAVPPGRYAVVGISPWGGIRCSGVYPCTMASLSQDLSVVDGVLDVVAGQVTSFTLSAPPPATIAGAPSLKLTYSEPMVELDHYLTARASFGQPLVQWLRDGEEIPGALGPTYAPTARDVGAQVSARLTYHPYATSVLRTDFGADGSPLTVPGPVIGPLGPHVATRTRATLRPKRVSPSQHARVAVHVTADQPPAGDVRVRLGGFRRTVELVDGHASVRLPRRGPGQYAVSVSFLGTATFEPSSARRTLVVARR